NGQFSQEEIADLKESFETFDRNGDGSISRRELHALLHIVGHKTNASNLEQYLAKYDTDQSGTIDFDEFLGLANNLIKNKLPDYDLTEEQIKEFKESFDSFDRNGDGSINVSELRSLLKLVGKDSSKASVESAMAEFDTNKDQHIDFDEFLALVDKFMTNKV
ncbi:hypothetical protein BGZ49_010271, partial [Haplosporangium sp. Z 27]